MENLNFDAILREYSEISREKLIIDLIVTKNRLREEKLLSTWLDRLADELREGENHNESSELYQEYNDFNESIRIRLMEKYGIEY